MSNQYLAFGTGGGANTLTYSAYAALTAIISDGFQPGVASSEQMNTVLRQTTVGVAALAQFAADNSLQNLLDDGNVTNFKNSIVLAVTNMIAAAGIVPSGAVMDFARNTAPTGWLECNGALVSRSTYAALFASIGTIWGAGDGSTTFQLPDFRGYFRRGWDHGAGVDAGRTFASLQADEFKTHQHTYGDDDAISQSLGFTKLSTGGTGAQNDSPGATYRTANDTTNFGGAETRPKNKAVLTCIKI